MFANGVVVIYTVLIFTASLPKRRWVQGFHLTSRIYLWVGRLFQQWSPVRLTMSISSTNEAVSKTIGAIIASSLFIISPLPDADEIAFISPTSWLPTRLSIVGKTGQVERTGPTEEVL